MFPPYGRLPRWRAPASVPMPALVETHDREERADANHQPTLSIVQVTPQTSAELDRTAAYRILRGVSRPYGILLDSKDSDAIQLHHQLMAQSIEEPPVCWRRTKES